MFFNDATRPRLPTAGCVLIFFSFTLGVWRLLLDLAAQRLEFLVGSLSFAACLKTSAFLACASVYPGDPAVFSHRCRSHLYEWMGHHRAAAEHAHHDHSTVADALHHMVEGNPQLCTRWSRNSAT